MEVEGKTKSLNGNDESSLNLLLDLKFFDLPAQEKEKIYKVFNAAVGLLIEHQGEKLLLLDVLWRVCEDVSDEEFYHLCDFLTGIGVFVKTENTIYDQNEIVSDENDVLKINNECEFITECNLAD